MPVARRCATLIVGVTAVWSLSLAPGTGRHASAAAETVLRVGGEGAPPLTLRDADLAHLPRTVVRVHEHAGTVATYAGALVRDILALAGVPQGEPLRGDRLALYVVVEAADGYRVVFALPELDAAVTDRVVLLADRRDEQPLPAAEGPLRLIIPTEQRHAGTPAGCGRWSCSPSAALHRGREEGCRWARWYAIRKAWTWRRSPRG